MRGKDQCITLEDLPRSVPTSRASSCYDLDITRYRVVKEVLLRTLQFIPNIQCPEKPFSGHSAFLQTGFLRVMIGNPQRPGACDERHLVADLKGIVELLSHIDALFALLRVQRQRVLRG